MKNAVATNELLLSVPLPATLGRPGLRLPGALLRVAQLRILSAVFCPLFRVTKADREKIFEDKKSVVRQKFFRYVVEN